MTASSNISSPYPWGNTRRFNAYSNYFRKIYGGRIQKISIDAGFSCPNRDGTSGSGGCTYCNNDAFNPSYCHPSKTITEQLEEGKIFLRKRYREPIAYLAYFQAYSNTYAPLKRLKKLYVEALSFPEIKGLIIGTRPDCIDAEKLNYFRELSEDYFIAVEYGVESCYDKTLRRINRGHSFSQAVDAITMTAESGVKTGAHFIFGLPGETRDEMLNEAEIISTLPLNTVKFHQLQIIRGTFMEKEFIANPEDFNLFSFDDYVNFFILFLERLNPEIVVERFTGEAPPDYLLEQLWSKKRTDEIVRIIEKKLEEQDTWQGRLYKTARLQDLKTARQQ
jgi:radical SAM protein (TIGR01212 family)